jgi:hypothetical protein
MDQIQRRGVNMPPKRKIQRRKPTIKRTKMGVSQEKRDVNPLLALGGAALGAGLGAKVGRTSGRKKVLSDVMSMGRYNTDPGATRSKFVADGKDSWGSPKYKAIDNKFATGSVLAAQKNKTPRGSYADEVLAADLARNGMRSSYGNERRTSNIDAKTMVRGSMSRAGKSGAKRGAARGAIAGGALAMLAQLVAAELDKKR